MNFFTPSQKTQVTQKRTRLIFLIYVKRKLYWRININIWLPSAWKKTLYLFIISFWPPVNAFVFALVERPVIIVVAMSELCCQVSPRSVFDYLEYVEKLHSRFIFFISKGHVTRSNSSCNLSRNDDDWKTLQVAEGVSHIRNIFSQLATRPLEIVYNSFSASLKSPASKRLPNFPKIALQVAVDMPQAATCLATLWKVENISTFLATRNATFCCRCRLQNWGVTREICLATYLATFVAR